MNFFNLKGGRFEVIDDPIGSNRGPVLETDFWYSPSLTPKGKRWINAGSVYTKDLTNGETMPIASAHIVEAGNHYELVLDIKKTRRH